MASELSNLDPSLRPDTLNSADDERDLSPQLQNRLSDFAQHVLGSQDDADNLLAFTAGEDGGLFGTHHSNQSYSGLLEAATEDQRVPALNEAKEEYSLEGLEENLDQDGLGEIPIGRTRGSGRKRRREGEDLENGDHADPIKVKKDSHVGLSILF